MSNILWLMADELRGDMTGFAGNRIIRTPNLDALARTATVFENAYTPAPVCIPARQCIAAGQLPTTCMCQRWYEDLPAGYPTFARVLSQNGYETIACGKLHHVGPDQMQGYTRRAGMECEVAQPFIPGLVKPHDAFGKKWTQQQEVERATTGKSFHIRQDEMAVLGAEYMIENYFTDPYYDRETPGRPLLLTVSFNQPHYPYVADGQLLKYYLPRVEPYVDQKVFKEPFLNKFTVEATHDQLRKATAAYYAMTEQVDIYIGRVLEALRRAGQDIADWLVIFTADHGEMLGQHGVWEKQKFFEGSARVPLLIHLPGQTAARRCSQNVSLCDLYATIMDCAGITPPPGLDSTSLAPLAAGAPGDPDKEVLTMHSGMSIMVKRGAKKYLLDTPTGDEVVFDLNADPSESKNLADLAEYRMFVEYGRKRAAEFGFHKLGESKS